MRRGLWKLPVIAAAAYVLAVAPPGPSDEIDLQVELALDDPLFILAPGEEVSLGGEVWNPTSSNAECEAQLWIWDDLGTHRILAASRQALVASHNCTVPWEISAVLPTSLTRDALQGVINVSGPEGEILLSEEFTIEIVSDAQSEWCDPRRQLLVMLEDRPALDCFNLVSAINSSLGTETVRVIPGIRTFVLGAPVSGSALELADEIAEIPGVDHVETNSLVQIPECQQQRSVAAIAGSLAAEQGATIDSLIALESALTLSRGWGIVVAILDTGVDLHHPLLVERLVSEKIDLVDGDDHPEDSVDHVDNDEDGFVDEGYSHGTAITGIIGHVAPSCRMMIIRIMDSDGNGYLCDLVTGITEAADRSCQVINLSVGMGEDSEILSQAVEYAFEQGSVCVAAAGNDGGEGILCPARLPIAVAVAATDGLDLKCSFSSYSPMVDVCAPGELVPSLHAAGGACAGTGTSFAVPIVSGAMALVFSLYPDCPRESSVVKLIEGAYGIDDLNPDYAGSLGWGRLDLYEGLLPPSPCGE